MKKITPKDREVFSAKTPVTGALNALVVAMRGHLHCEVKVAEPNEYGWVRVYVAPKDQGYALCFVQGFRAGREFSP